MQYRADRLSGLIQRELADILTHEMRDPRLGLISILEVTADADLSSAKVYISVMKEEEQEDILAVLNSAKGFLRSALAKRIKVRNVPELIFVMNDSIAYAVRMNKVIDDQIKIDEANAKSRGDEEEGKENTTDEQ